MGNPVVHFEINSANPERSRAFYAQLFGWEIKDSPEVPYGLVNTQAEDGINGGVNRVGAYPAVAAEAVPAAPPAGITFYVRVDDLQKYLDRAVELGGRALVGPTRLMKGVTLAMFEDPEGHVIGLVRG